jgi:excisionase family DNA binding protein
MTVRVTVALNGVPVPVEIGQEALAAIAAAMPSRGDPEPSPFLTIPEAAELLRSKRQRVDDLLSAGRLARHKDGSRTLVSRAELLAYLGGAGEGRTALTKEKPRRPQ